MSELELQDAILRHSLQILRLSAGEEAHADAILIELERELKDLLETGNLADATKRDIQALIRQADDAISTGYSRVGASLDTHALAVVIAQKTQEIIQDVIPVVVKLPSDALLMQLGKDILIDGAPSSAWWAKQSENLAFKFAAQVRQGIVNNETQERIVQRIVGKRGEPGIMDRARSDVRALVHSSVMTAANQARLATFKKNADIIKGVRYLATLDGHVCARCAALDGQSWNLDGEKLRGTTVQFIAPPLHFACFPEGTSVLSRRPITGASKRWFDGEVVVVKTAAGRELTCTPNHPILTDGGWSAAGLLNVGSNVVCDGGSEWEGLSNGNGKDVPASIHHIAESFFASRQMRPMPVEVSPEDFHGDGGGSKIAIIWSDGLLRDEGYTFCRKHLRQSLFVNGSSTGLIGFTAGGTLTESIETWLSALHEELGTFGHALAVLGSGALHPSELLPTGIPNGNSRSFENGEDNCPWDSKLVPYASSTNAIAVEIENRILAASCGAKCGIDSSLNLPSQGLSSLKQNSVDGFAIKIEALGDNGPRLTSGISRNDLYIRGVLSDAPAQLDATSLQSIGDRCASASNLESDFFSRPPESVLLDQVVGIDVRSFSGHVYNLETDGGWYVAQSLVVHNCRCVLTPTPKTFAEIGLDIPEPADVGSRASSLGPVAGDTTFNSFLDRQTPEFIDRVLGKKRAELFRSGKITVRDLVSGTGRALTLDELRLH